MFKFTNQRIFRFVIFVLSRVTAIMKCVHNDLRYGGMENKRQCIFTMSKTSCSSATVFPRFLLEHPFSQLTQNLPNALVVSRTGCRRHHRVEKQTLSVHLNNSMRDAREPAGGGGGAQFCQHSRENVQHNYCRPIITIVIITSYIVITTTAPYIIAPPRTSSTFCLNLLRTQPPP